MKSLDELMSLQGRVALVTGGAGHIGVAICEALAELGAAIVVLDVARESCTEVAKRIHEKHDVETRSLVVDLSDHELPPSVPGDVLNRFGRLDILVNCAALVGTSELKGWANPFLEQSAETWRLALEVNLTSPLGGSEFLA
jgi:NAD(P)-dependent dehydrogenase (short-subunit alcohol dehydrogenase family)